MNPLDILLSTRLHLACVSAGVPGHHLTGQCPYFMPKRVRDKWNDMHFVNQYQATQVAWTQFMNSAWAS